MIHTITLTPFVEKRIRGHQEDEIYFKTKRISYTSGGMGIVVTKFLKTFAIESKAHFICSHKIISFIKEDLDRDKINYSYLETNEQMKTNLVFIEDEQQCFEIKQQNIPIQENYVYLFGSHIKDEIKKDDVCVFAYHQKDLSLDCMKTFYQMISASKGIMICDLHPKYYPMMKLHPVNVLIMDEKQYQEDSHSKSNEPLSQKIAYIKKNFTYYAKIIIYVINHNDLLFFLEDEIYRVVCSVKNKDYAIYKEAIICGVIKCYLDDGDLNRLSEDCLTMSVATSLSDGLQAPNRATLHALKDKITMYKI